MNKKTDHAPQETNIIEVLVQGLTERVIRQEALSGIEPMDDAADTSGLFKTAEDRLLKDWNIQQQYAATQMAIMNALPANIALLDTSGTIISVNSAWRQFARTSALSLPDSGIGANYLEVCDRAAGKDSDNAAQTAAGIRSILSGQSREFVIEYPCHPPGAQRWFRLMVTPLNGSRPAGAVVMHIDITDRKLAEQALLASETEFRALFEYAGIGIAMADCRDSRILRCNDTLAEMLGYSNSELCNLSIREISHAEEFEKDWILWQQLISGEKERFQLEKRYRTRQGHWVWGLLTATLVRDAAGQPRFVVGMIENIDARRAAEHDALLAAQRIRASEEQYRLLFQSNPHPMWVYDTETLRFLAVNRAAIAHYGWSEREFLNMTIQDIRSPDERRNPEHTPAKSRAGNESHRQVRHRRKGGDIIDVDISSNSIVFGGYPARLALAHDITKSRRAELALRASEASMAAAQHIAHVGSWELDLADLNDIDGNTVRWSDEMFRIAGYRPGEVPVTSALFFDHVHPEDRERVHQAVDDAIRNRNNFSVIHGFTRHDGSHRILHVMGQLISEPDTGVPLKILGTAHDITEQQLAQAELVRNNRALLMYSSCNEAMVRSSEETELLEDICRIAVEIGGYRMAWVGFANDDEQGSIMPMAHAGHGEDYLSDISISWHADSPYGQGPSGRAIRSGDMVICEDFNKDAAFKPWLAQAQKHGYKGCVTLPLRDETRIFGVLNLYTSGDTQVGDEESHLLMELANDLAFGILHIRAQRDNLVLQSAVTKVATSISATNDVEFFTSLTRSMAEAVGADIGVIARLLPGGKVADTIAAIVDDAVVENFSYLLEHTPCKKYLDSDESAVSTSLTDLFPDCPAARFGAIAYVGRRLTNASGQPIGLVFVAFRKPIQRTDFITSTLRIFGARAAAELERLDSERARISLEKKLIEAQKMEAIGTLAGGIAHDFNNILAAILGNAELVRRDITSNSDVIESLAEIEKAGRRAKDLVQQILSFSRRQPSVRRAVELLPIIEESTRLLRSTLPARVEIVLKNATFKPAVLGDPTQIEQVLLNLGSNAAHAMDGKPGRIVISCKEVVLDASESTIISRLHAGKYARISVSDNGHGMDTTTMQRIFEPFYTTKPLGEGTGLGLSASHGIMRLHDGSIEVQSEPGKGSRFDLYFPLVELPVTAPKHATKSVVPSIGNGQHILYIDDDEAIVFLIKRMLERMGYRVSAYTNQSAALDVLQRDPHGIDLFISDYNMPGKSGLDFAKLSRDIRPDLPVVLLSGYITDELREQAARNGVRELVFKPNTAQELGDVVQRLIRAVNN